MRQPPRPRPVGPLTLVTRAWSRAGAWHVAVGRCPWCGERHRVTLGATRPAMLAGTYPLPCGYLVDVVARNGTEVRP